MPWSRADDLFVEEASLLGSCTCHVCICAIWHSSICLTSSHNRLRSCNPWSRFDGPGKEEPLGNRYDKLRSLPTVLSITLLPEGKLVRDRLLETSVFMSVEGVVAIDSADDTGILHLCSLICILMSKHKNKGYKIGFLDPVSNIMFENTNGQSSII